MKIVFYTNSLSPHQIPLAKEIVKLVGEDDYRYVYTTPLTDERTRLGWGIVNVKWALLESDAPLLCRELLENCDVLISGLRDLALFERRSGKGKKTIYSSERWFKPVSIGFCRYRWLVDGRVRMLVPSYRKMAASIMQLVKADPNFMLYPMGIHAARDFAWLLRCKILNYERRPGGRFLGMGAHLYKMRLWGYFVAPSLLQGSRPERSKSSTRLKVLWVGRLIEWKRVDTIVRAARLCPNIDFTIIGCGSMKSLILKMAKGLANVQLLDSVPIDEVRTYMRSHDVYVLASHAQEGWGAALSEALEEGMKAVGSYEAGSSATMLPCSCLFHAGDYKRLAELLKSSLPDVEIGAWTAKRTAQCVLEFTKI